MKPSHNILLSFGINGSLRKRTVQSLSPYTEYYLFNSAANLKAYSNNGLDFAYYGYNASNTRSYKLSMLNQNQWVNGQPCPIRLQLQNAMFYPNAYLNFNQNGDYTKHYYNGSKRIASRLGNTATSVTTTANARLSSRSNQLASRFQEDMQELLAEATSISSPVVMTVNSLNTTATASNIFYYHTNHLGSTAFVTDQNQNITQGFLYAPFGEITTEFNATFGNDVIPKYSFNAKELDEETGMYYYEARYYKPPVFTSRDPMFEKYFWMTPYAYCANNPVKYVDPSGEDFDPVIEGNTITINAVYYTSNELKAELKEALDVWNNQSGKFTKEIDGKVYVVMFNLTVDEDDYENIEDAKEAFYNALPGNNSLNSANFYEGHTFNKDGVEGNTRNGFIINLNPNVSKKTHTLAHEIGHTLGIGHWSKGLMYKDNSSTMDIRQEYIDQMLSRPGIGTLRNTYIINPVYKNDEEKTEEDLFWKNKFNNYRTVF